MLSILIISFKPIYLCSVRFDCCFYEYILNWGVFLRRSRQSGRFFSATCRDFVPLWSFGSTASLQISSVYRIPPPPFPRMIPRLESSGSCMVSDCLGEMVPLQLSCSFCPSSVLFYSRSSLTPCALVCQATHEASSLTGGLNRRVMGELKWTFVWSAWGRTLPRKRHECAQTREGAFAQSRGGKKRERREQNVSEQQWIAEMTIFSVSSDW